eukprot:SAG31_NODE_9699_length_1240_cov_1.452235_2_plen_169_part_00
MLRQVGIAISGVPVQRNSSAPSRPRWAKSAEIDCFAHDRPAIIMPGSACLSCCRRPHHPGAGLPGIGPMLGPTLNLGTGRTDARNLLNLNLVVRTIRKWAARGHRRRYDHSDTRGPCHLLNLVGTKFSRALICVTAVLNFSTRTPSGLPKLHIAGDRSNNTDILYGLE